MVADFRAVVVFWWSTRHRVQKGGEAVVGWVNNEFDDWRGVARTPKDGEVKDVSCDKEDRKGLWDSVLGDERRHRQVWEEGASRFP